MLGLFDTEGAEDGGESGRLLLMVIRIVEFGLRVWRMVTLWSCMGGIDFAQIVESWCG